MERPFPGALSWTWQYPQAGQAVTQIMPPRDNGVILPRTHSRFELASKKKKSTVAPAERIPFLSTLRAVSEDLSVQGHAKARSWVHLQIWGLWLV